MMLSWHLPQLPEPLLSFVRNGARTANPLLQCPMTVIVGSRTDARMDGGTDGGIFVLLSRPAGSSPNRSTCARDRQIKPRQHPRLLPSLAAPSARRRVARLRQDSAGSKVTPRRVPDRVRIVKKRNTGQITSSKADH